MCPRPPLTSPQFAWNLAGAFVGLPPVGRACFEQVERTLIIAAFSADVTHSPYFFFTATCAATYVQRYALGGTQVAVSPSPLLRLGLAPTVGG